MLWCFGELLSDELYEGWRFGRENRARNVVYVSMQMPNLFKDANRAQAGD